MTTIDRLSPEENLQFYARLLCTLGWRMALCGAETRLIVQSVKVMAQDLGIGSIELALSRNSIAVKIRQGRSYCDYFKEIKSFGINMSSLVRLNKICAAVSAGEIQDPREIFRKIRSVRPHHYSRNLLIGFEALAAGAFAYLNGGDVHVCTAAIIGGLVLMYIRFTFISKGFFEIFAFMMAAFCGSSVSMLVSHFVLGADRTEVSLALMATVLLLVPGFPFMNGFLDVFKGYTEVGISRLIQASILTMAAAMGILGSFFVMHLIL